MKKKIVSLLLIAVLALSMTACGSKDASGTPANNQDGSQTGDSPSDTPADDPAGIPAGDSQSGLSGTIVITGSTSVDKIVNDMINEFTAANPDVTINYTGTGSSAGIQDTIDGINTLGAASRELKDEETAAGVKSEVFAYDGIALIVNPANEIQDISIEDLAKIYSGEITNWNQVGGKDAPIVVVSREGASGTRSAFEELLKLEDAGGLTEEAMVVEGNGNVQATVAGNENAVGYVSFSFIDETVKALTVGGAKASAENAKAGSYPLSRPFLLVYTDASMTDLAQAFVDFAKSDDGQSFVEAHGGIRID